MKFDQLLNDLYEMAHPDVFLTIGIYGHGASGKSTFAERLLLKFDENQVNFLETDPYIIDGNYRSSVVPKENTNQKVTACMPVAHELESLARDIKMLQSGYDLITIDTFYAPSRLLSGAKKVLIVEGMSVGFLDKALFDVMICLCTDEQTELTRRLERDVAKRGRNPEFVKQTHLSRRQQYESYYKQTESKADILVEQLSKDILIKKLSHSKIDN